MCFSLRMCVYIAQVGTYESHGVELCLQTEGKLSSVAEYEHFYRCKMHCIASAQE